MNTAKNILKIVAFLLCYGLIIAGFVIFGESLPTNVKVLDIVVIGVYLAHFAAFSFVPLINRNKPDQKEVGMLGIGIHFLNLCMLLSFTIMLVCIILFANEVEVPFVWQLLGQGVVLLILLIGHISALSSGQKVKEVYDEEKVIMEGKVSMKTVMNNVVDDLMYVTDIDASAKDRLEEIRQTLRFVSPSIKPEATSLEQRFCDKAEGLRVLLRNASLNKEMIFAEIEQLEKILARRKEY